jgi:dihydrofolate reductase
MRKIITITYTTLDGVMQAPGGAQEDTSNGFAYGGWQFGEGWDDIADSFLTKYLETPFELLLGRVTYDIWVSYWPNHDDDERIGKRFNSTKKYVVSHKPLELSWNNSELITGDVVAQIRKLKEMDGPDLVVWGSGNLIQTLLKNNLVDRMHIWTYPVTIGTGKKLFAEGTQAERFKPVELKITTTGIVIGTYEPLNPL